MGNLLRALALAGLGTIAVSSCSTVQPTHIEDSATLTQQISSIRLDMEAGGVNVEGRADAGPVALKRNFSYHGAKPSDVTYRVENGQLVLGGCGTDCAVTYTLTVPVNLPVSGSTTTGAITLSRVGSVDVSTHDGHVQLDNVAGPVKAETSNGRIQGQAINGSKVEAKTSNGSIDLTLAVAQDVRATTSNGSVTLAVPNGNYQVSAETTNGRKNIDVPNTPAGQYHLDIRTSNGQITVKPA
ncbi:hypothetical protein D5S18_19075 [Nocardia panacis]|uniref:DUF4097 domain-containing protein n=1 Tax=Nocardia panacis TaxID=2340916 RepID=A0A3A4K0W8_9NOCA|nr:DUF4097 family beta strand repeat-containing protein [Nocardia panacis]RJO73350.1 hypothetical protein D5S18_19075 [Nocardia panacis]